MKTEEVARYCENCNGIRAAKTSRIQKFPENVLIQLKRFDGLGKDKNKHLVAIPTKLGQTHQLTAVIEHLGATTYCGHYRAKCWSQIAQQWHTIDDSFVKEMEERRLQSENAYILMYTKEGEEDTTTHIVKECIPREKRTVKISERMEQYREAKLKKTERKDGEKSQQKIKKKNAKNIKRKT